MLLRSRNVQRIKIYRSYTKSSSGNNNLNNSALAERFQQILDEKISSTPTSLVDSDSKLKKLYDKYQGEQSKDNVFKQDYQEQIALLKNESILKHNKHAYDIANTLISEPWRGTESNSDANLRMILDSKPKELKVSKNAKVKASTNVKDRIINAKETSLDYKLNKQPEDNFRELYKERLLGPSMLLNSSSPTVTIGLINSLADSKINAVINNKTGRFDNESMDNVRGKPLHKEHLINCGDTNYFMNQILQKQEVLPPWIENQQSIDKEIKGFRETLDKIWFKCIFKRFKPEVNSKETFFKNLKDTNLNELYKFNSIANEKQYLNEKLKLINNLIRDYNLQAPSSNFHKFKLDLNNEIKKSFDRSTSNIFKNFEQWFVNEENSLSKRSNNVLNYKGTSMFDLFNTVGSGGNIDSDKQENVEKINLWKSIKDIFK